MFSGPVFIKHLRVGVLIQDQVHSFESKRQNWYYCKSALLLWDACIYRCAAERCCALCWMCAERESPGVCLMRVNVLWGNHAVVSLVLLRLFQQGEKLLLPVCLIMSTVVSITHTGQWGKEDSVNTSWAGSQGRLDVNGSTRLRMSGPLEAQHSHVTRSLFFYN